MLHALQQKEIFDVFTDDWKSLGTGLEAEDQTGHESMDLLLHRTFIDPNYTKNKIISCINWHPTIHGKLEHPALKKKKQMGFSGQNPILINPETY